MILWIFVANFFVCALCQTTEPSQTDLTSLLETLFTPVPETNTTSDAISNETTNVITNVINDVTTDSGETENRLSESNPCPTGECLPYYQCQNGTIITDGENILDVRLGADDDPMPERHPCKDFFDTCCSLRSDMPDKAIPPEIKYDKCGVRNANGVGFMVKTRDSEAQYGEFPWAIAILIKQMHELGTMNVYLCGGSLIHPSVIATAAHCVHNKSASELLIRAGEWDTQTRKEPYPHQDRQVVEILIHENYKIGKLFNDFALLFLDEPVKMGENVNTVCLPPQNMNFDRKRCFASGWGKDKFGKEGVYQAILKRVELGIVPHDECETRLRKTRLGKYFTLNESFICAGGEPGKDTCKGDGGSPLVCPIAGKLNQFYQAGIVAWGIGCGDAHPAVYVNVPIFREWVDGIFMKRNMDSKYYISDYCR